MVTLLVACVLLLRRRLLVAAIPAHGRRRLPSLMRVWVVRVVLLCRRLLVAAEIRIHLEPGILMTISVSCPPCKGLLQYRRPFVATVAAYLEPCALHPCRAAPNPPSALAKAWTCTFQHSRQVHLLEEEHHAARERESAAGAESRVETRPRNMRQARSMAL